jgi:hypothetical protein
MSFEEHSMRYPMRILGMTAGHAMLTMVGATGAQACCWSGCLAAVEPVLPCTVVRAAPINPFYVVNQGPVLSGPGIYAYTNTYYPVVVRPTYPRDGFGYFDPPYRAYSYAHGYPYAYPYVRFHRRHCPYGWVNGCGSGYAVRPMRPYGRVPYVYGYRRAGY